MQQKYKQKQRYTDTHLHIICAHEMHDWCCFVLFYMKSYCFFCFVVSQNIKIYYIYVLVERAGFMKQIRHLTIIGLQIRFVPKLVLDMMGFGKKKKYQWQLINSYMESFEINSVLLLDWRGILRLVVEFHILILECSASLSKNWIWM